MDMDNRVGADCGSMEWAGQRRAKGDWDNCNRTIKYLTKKIKGFFSLAVILKLNLEKISIKGIR